MEDNLGNLKMTTSVYTEVVIKEISNLIFY